MLPARVRHTGVYVDLLPSVVLRTHLSPEVEAEREINVHRSLESRIFGASGFFERQIFGASDIFVASDL